MNTNRSDALVRAFREQPSQFSRQIIEFSGDLPADPETVFPLLCPTRECDWIPGWTCELIHTTTGYVENGCIFRTSVDNFPGPGIWVITRHEPARVLELVRVMPGLVKQLKIELTPNPDGTTRSDWTLIFTGFDEKGNAIIDAIDADGDEHQLPLLLLRHYLKTGDQPSVSEMERHHGGGDQGSSLWERLEGLPSD